jgi:hypothetical protein
MSVEELSLEIARLKQQIEFMRPKVNLYYIMEAQQQNNSSASQTEKSVDFARLELLASVRQRDMEIERLNYEIRALCEFINDPSLSVPTLTYKRIFPDSQSAQDSPQRSDLLAGYAQDLLVEELRRQLTGALAQIRSQSKENSEETEILKAELDRARTNLLAVEQELRQRDIEAASPKRIAVVLRDICRNI